MPRSAMRGMSVTCNILSHSRHFPQVRPGRLASRQTAPYPI